MSPTPASDSLRADRLPEVRRRFLEIRALAEVRRLGIEFHDAIRQHRLFGRMQAIGAKLDA